MPPIKQSHLDNVVLERRATCTVVYIAHCTAWGSPLYSAARADSKNQNKSREIPGSSLVRKVVEGSGLYRKAFNSDRVFSELGSVVFCVC